jgi:hypothetical protein
MPVITHVVHLLAALARHCSALATTLLILPHCSAAIAAAVAASRPINDQNMKDYKNSPAEAAPRKPSAKAAPASKPAARGELTTPLLAFVQLND